jgi:hypothetical protein
MRIVVDANKRKTIGGGGDINAGAAYLSPLQKMIFFSMFHTSCGYEILGTCT